MGKEKRCSVCRSLDAHCENALLFATDATDNDIVCFERECAFIFVDGMKAGIAATNLDTALCEEHAEMFSDLTGKLIPCTKE